MLGEMESMERVQNPWFSWTWSISLCFLIAGCGSTYTSDPNLKVIWQLVDTYDPNDIRYVYGYLDTQGEVAVYPQYAFAMPFGEGLGGVNVGGTARGKRMPTNGKWGFIDPYGRFDISPKYYSPNEAGGPYDQRSFALAQHEAYQFSEGLAAVYTQDGSWLYIDKLDSVVINRPDILSARRFHEGLANVCIRNRQTGQLLWGYINRLGETVIPPKYLYPADFKEGYAMVVTRYRGQFRRSLIDQQGKIHLPQWQLTTPLFEGMAAAKAYWLGERPQGAAARQLVLVDKEGKPTSEAIYDDAGTYGEGLFPVLFGSSQGHPIANPQTPEPTEEVGGKWGFVDRWGNMIINPKYEDAKGFIEGFAPIKSAGYWTYLTRDYSPLTQFEFRWVGPFADGVALVRLGPIHNDFDGLYAYLNTAGDILWIEPMFP